MRGQLYHGLYLIISPLHGHGEVANENPLILPRTLSIVEALVLKRRAGKKMRAPLLGLPKSICYGVIDYTLRSVLYTVSYLQGKAPQHVKLISWSNCDNFVLQLTSVFNYYYPYGGSRRKPSHLLTKRCFHASTAGTGSLLD